LLMQEMVNNKQLVVGGTSAGTAVQAGATRNNNSVPMISNGAPKVALNRGAFAVDAPSARCSETKTCSDIKVNADDLTYRAVGGTGLFRLGLMDTHFSERDREARLAVFSVFTGQRFAFGVDETTALLVDINQAGDYAFEVVGQNGVFILDMKASQAQINKDSPNQNYISGMSHFINQGDSASYEAKNGRFAIAFSSASQQLATRKKAKFAIDSKGKWRAVVANKCGSRELISWMNWQQVFAVQASQQTRFARTEHKQCSYSDLPFVIKTAAQ
jgi:hypothetical protein